MNRSPVRWSVAGLLMAMLLLSVGCKGYDDGSRRTIGEFTDDVAIQSRLKLALLNDDDIKGLRINTEVNRGVVTLQGQVPTHELQQRAVYLATSIKGVRRVVDKLVVTE